MSIKKMSKEELETLSYNDIAFMLLKEEKEQTTADLFKKIVDLLELGDKVYANKIGNFYTSLTTDKRFTLLETGKWDLQVNHPSNNIIVEEDDEIEEIEEQDEEEYAEEKDEYYNENEDDDIDEELEEYKNLVIIDEEDLDSVE